MFALTFPAAKKMLNSGNEQTAQALRLNLAELYIGVGPTAYMEAADARQHLQPEHYQPGLNALYLHLTEAGLKEILKKGRFVISED